MFQKSLFFLIKQSKRGKFPQIQYFFDKINKKRLIYLSFETKLFIK